MCKKHVSEQPMKKIFSFLLCIAITLPITSCFGVTPSAHSLLSDFIASFGAVGVIYSPSVPEGDIGYVSEDFFITLYGAPQDSESDYAVFLSSSLDSVYEAGVFVCRDESSALYAEGLCRGRLRLLSAMGFDGNAVVLRRRGVIFYSALPDSERAERIFRDLAISQS